MIRVLVCGGRGYDNQTLVDRVLDGLFAAHSGALVVIHGAASGADACANAWAMAKRVGGASVGIQRFPAEWRGPTGRGLMDPSAGPRRNATMLREGKPDLVIAFPGGRGTADMVARARVAGVRILEVLNGEEAICG
jgi:predicted Rossmann-fold nucleotide-binding protein